ncbi:MAG TPA: hypothetical protein VFU80_07260 [Sphingomicrobium sp.]|nr:hypothetical protein [Sphingomicrobium sp.]
MLPHIHLPKAAKTWAELLIEIAVIGVGVLIALSLEAWLEDREWHRKVETAQAAMKRELLWDNGPQIYYRAAAHPCATGKLDEIRAAIEGNASREDISDLIDGYWVEFLTYDSLAHQDAAASDVAAHMAPEELDDFTVAYAVMPLMDETSRKEAADVARLRALRRTGGALSEYEEMEVLGAVEALRNDEHQMYDAARWAMTPIKRLGPLDRARIERFMRMAREHYGDCIKGLPADWPAGDPLN